MDKFINIGLIVVIIASIFGGRYYYSQNLNLGLYIENTQKKIESLRKEITATKSKVNTLGIRQLNNEKSRLEKQQEQLKTKLESI